MMRQTNKQALEALEERRQTDGLQLRKDKKGRFIFYKIVWASDRRPWVYCGASICYTDGAVVEVPRVNRNPGEDCALGLHVLLGKPERYDPDAVLIAVAVAPEDVACVPFWGEYAGRPKLRVRKLEVLGKRSWAR